VTAGAVIGAVAGALLIAEPAGAHVGLPAAGAVDGATHPLLGLDHLLAMVAIGVLAAIAGNRRVAWLTPAGFVAGMVLGGVVGLADVALPAVEILIAASVVVLGGLVIAFSRQSGLWQSALWLPALAAIFGAAHGHAHGAELPTGAVPLAYVAGFVAATIVLHASGTVLGVALRRLPSARIATGAAISTAGLAILVGV
jgi:urease accessory protein